MEESCPPSNWIFPFFWQQQLDFVQRHSVPSLCPCAFRQKWPLHWLLRKVCDPDPANHSMTSSCSVRVREEWESQGSKSDPIRAHPEIFAWGLQKTTCSPFPTVVHRKDSIWVLLMPHYHSLPEGPTQRKPSETDSLMTGFEHLNPAVTEPDRSMPPDFTITWNHVCLAYTNLSLGGIQERDIESK